MSAQSPASPPDVQDKPALPEKRSIVALAGVYAGGNILSSFLRIAGGLLTARIVDPSVMGLFSSFGLVLGYAPFLQLGILNGLNRELPYYLGKGDRQRALDLCASAQAWAVLVGGTISVGLSCAAVWALVHGEFAHAAGWATNAVSALLLLYVQTYLQVTFRTGGDFARLSIVTVVQNTLSILLVPLLALAPFYGLCVRSLVVGLTGGILLFRARPLRVGLHIRFSDLLHLLKIGAPIFAASQLWTWYGLLDSTLVLRYMGTRHLGLYALALMVGGPFSLLISSVSQVIYPRMAEEYGRTERVGNLIRLSVRPTVLLVAVMVPTAAASWFALPYIVRILLPKYAEGVVAGQWGILAASVLCAIPPFCIFNVIKRQDLYAVGIVAGVAAYCGTLYAITRTSFSLERFPQAVFVGNLVYVVVNYLFVAYLLRPKVRPAGGDGPK